MLCFSFSRGQRGTFSGTKFFKSRLAKALRWGRVALCIYGFVARPNSFSLSFFVAAKARRSSASWAFLFAFTSSGAGSPLVGSGPSLRVNKEEGLTRSSHLSPFFFFHLLTHCTFFSVAAVRLGSSDLVGISRSSTHPSRHKWIHRTTLSSISSKTRATCHQSFARHHLQGYPCLMLPRCLIAPKELIH